MDKKKAQTFEFGFPALKDIFHQITVKKIRGTSFRSRYREGEKSI